MVGTSLGVSTLQWPMSLLHAWVTRGKLCAVPVVSHTPTPPPGLAGVPWGFPVGFLVASVTWVHGWGEMRGPQQGVAHDQGYWGDPWGRGDIGGTKSGTDMRVQEQGWG